MTDIKWDYLELDQLQPQKMAARFDASDSSIEELAASIREVGLIQPLVVRQTETGYDLIAGRRRLLALQMLGDEMAPCVVIRTDDTTAGLMTITENLQRTDLNPIEEAIGFEELKQATGWSDSEIALKIGKRREYVTRARSLLDLDEDTMGAVAKKELSPSHAYELRRIEDPDRRAYWRHWTVEYGATVNQLRDWVKSDVQVPLTKQSPDPPPMTSSAPLEAETYQLTCIVCTTTNSHAVLKSVWFCQNCYDLLQKQLWAPEEEPRKEPVG